MTPKFGDLSELAVCHCLLLSTKGLCTAIDSVHTHHRKLQLQVAHYETMTGNFGGPLLARYGHSRVRSMLICPFSC